MDDTKYLVKVRTGKKIKKIKGTIPYLTNYFKEVLSPSGDDKREFKTMTELISALNSSPCELSAETGERMTTYEEYNYENEPQAFGRG